MSKTDQEMIDKWLETNTPKRYEEPELTYTPYTGRLIATNILTSEEFYGDKRKYRFLNKAVIGESLDESKRNYGA